LLAKAHYQTLVRKKWGKRTKGKSCTFPPVCWRMGRLLRGTKEETLDHEEPDHNGGHGQGHGDDGVKVRNEVRSKGGEIGDGISQDDVIHICFCLFVFVLFTVYLGIQSIV